MSGTSPGGPWSCCWLRTGRSDRPPETRLAPRVPVAHRMGQQRPGFDYRMSAKDTVEEKVLELQKSREPQAGGPGVVAVLGRGALIGRQKRGLRRVSPWLIGLVNSGLDLLIG